MPDVISDLHRQSNLGLSHPQNLLVGLLSVFLYILARVRNLSQMHEPGLCSAGSCTSAGRAETKSGLPGQAVQEKQTPRAKRWHVAPTANCCTFGAGSTEIPGMGCLVAGSRITSLSFVSFLWDSECLETALGHEPKRRK